jgi:hypothetical protein
MDQRFVIILFCLAVVTAGAFFLAGMATSDQAAVTLSAQ